MSNNNSDYTDGICSLESRDSLENDLKSIKADVLNSNRQEEVANLGILESIRKFNCEPNDVNTQNVSWTLQEEMSSSKIHADDDDASALEERVFNSVLSDFATPKISTQFSSMKFLAQSTPVVPDVKSPSVTLSSGHCLEDTPVSKITNVYLCSPQISPKASQVTISSLQFVSPTSSELRNLCETINGDGGVDEINQMNGTTSIKQDNLASDNINLACLTDGSPSKSLEQAMMHALDKVSSSCTDDERGDVNGESLRFPI